MTRRPAAPGDDRRLHDLFAALRQEDRRALPGFDRLLAEARLGSRRPVRSRWVWIPAGALAVAAAAAILAVALRVHPWRAPEPTSLAEALAIAREIEAWEAPTDALSEITWLKIPDTVPTLEFTSVTLPTFATPAANHDADGATQHGSSHDTQRDTQHESPKETP